MFKSIFSALVFGAVVGGLLSPAAQAGPSASASTGRSAVEMQVSAESCVEATEPDWTGDALVQAVVEARIQNAGAVPLTVRRDQFRLTAPDGSAVPPATWFAAQPMSIGAGQSRTFELRFLSRGGLTCAGEVALDPAAGVETGATAVKLAPVPLLPARF